RGAPTRSGRAGSGSSPPRAPRLRRRARGTDLRSARPSRRPAASTRRSLRGRSLSRFRSDTPAPLLLSFHEVAKTVEVVGELALLELGALLGFLLGPPAGRLQHLGEPLALDDDRAVSVEHGAVARTDDVAAHRPAP